MAGGQQPKPEAVLKLHGDYRKDRHAGRGPKTGGEPLRKPDDLPEKASWLWDEITRTRAIWLASSDAASLRTLCEAYHHMQCCSELLLKDPTEKQARCSWASYAGVFKSLASRFGITPSDRARLGEDKPMADENREMEEMIG